MSGAESAAGLEDSAGPGVAVAIGMPVECRDARVGRLERVLVDPVSHRVLYLVVANGLPSHRDVLVPIALADPNRDGAVVLNMTRAEFEQLRHVDAHDQPAGPGAPAREDQTLIRLHALPLARPPGELRQLGQARGIERGTRVTCTDGEAGHVEAVLLDPTSGEARALVIRERRLFGHDRVVPVSWIVDFSTEVVTLGVPRAEVASRPEFRPDGDLLADVQAALEDEDPIRMLGLRLVDVVVAHGTVVLRGHVPRRMMAHGMVQRVRDVPGVLAVEEQLIADDQLELAVAAAIGRGRLSRTARLRIRSQLSKVLVGGEFPSPEARTEALRLAAGVPGVVAVVDASTLPDPVTRGPLG